MDKSDYKDKHYMGVYVPSKNSDLYQRMNVDYWPK